MLSPQNEKAAAFITEIYYSSGIPPNPLTGGNPAHSGGRNQETKHDLEYLNLFL